MMATNMFSDRSRDKNLNALTEFGLIYCKFSV